MTSFHPPLQFVSLYLCPSHRQTETWARQQRRINAGSHSSQKCVCEDLHVFVCVKPRSQRSWYPHRLTHTWEPVKKQAILLEIRRWRAAAAEILLHGFPEASKNSVIYPIKDIKYRHTLLKCSLLLPCSSSGSNSTSNNALIITSSLFQRYRHMILFFLNPPYFFHKSSAAIVRGFRLHPLPVIFSTTKQLVMLLDIANYYFLPYYFRRNYKQTGL